MSKLIAVYFLMLLNGCTAPRTPHLIECYQDGKVFQHFVSKGMVYEYHGYVKFIDIKTNKEVSIFAPHCVVTE